MCDLVPFAQFKKREKQHWGSVTFSKFAGFKVCNFTKSKGVFHVFKIVQIVPNRVTYHILFTNLRPTQQIFSCLRQL